MDASDFFTLEGQGTTRTLHLRGEWNIEHLPALEVQMRRLAPARSSSLSIDTSQLTALDTSGAWMLRQLVQRLVHAGVSPEMPELSPRYSALLTLTDVDTALPDSQDSLRPLPRLVERLGLASMEAAGGARMLIAFFGEAAFTLFRSLFTSASARWNAITRHIDETGIDAVPIVALIAFLISVVLAYQGANQLRQFGADIFTVDLTAISVLREMGVLLTAIMVAGRSGSAFTAEIGVMKVNQELDAMQVMGLNPFEILVIPRIIALLITLPLLTFLADIMGLFGAGVISYQLLGISMDQYIARISEAVSIKHFWVGMIKAPVFAFLIGIVGCLCGMRVSGSAESVGRLTTVSVVASIFLVLLADALFSILFSHLKI